MFGISLCSLLGYHIHLVLHNRTTLEAFRAPVFRWILKSFWYILKWIQFYREGPAKDGFSLGKAGNITEVFGDKGWLMVLPMFSSLGDGLTFPQRFPEDVELGQSNREEGAH